MEDEVDVSENLESVEVIYSDGESDDQSEEIFEEVADFDELEIEVNDISKHTFIQHKCSVFICALRNDGQYMVTGGEDDTAFVWDMTTKNVYFECTGHKDSVTEVGFNHDGSLVVTADMGGMVQVWNIAEQKLTWCTDGDDLEWLFWHPKANVLLSGCHSGDIYIWQIPQGNLKVLTTHGPSSVCGQIFPDGKQLVSGYADGQLKLWDIKSATVVWQLTEPLSRGIANIALNKDGTLIAVAPTSQIILSADGRVTATLQTNKEEPQIEALLLNSELGILVTGDLSGELCVWDLNRHTLRHRASIQASVTIMKWGNDGRVFVGATDGCVYVCDVRSGQLEKTLTGHKKDVLDIQVFGDGKFILTCSDDCTVKLFEV